MKKSIFLLAAGAIALTACTQSEVVEEGVQSNAISFQHMVSKETRAISLDNFKHFYVYGYYTQEGKITPVNVFNGTHVFIPEGQTTWTYEDARYWVPDMNYVFYAYSCENSAFATGKGTANMDMQGTDIDTRALAINNFICDADHQHDLIFAGTEQPIKAKNKDNPTVAFNFHHILSRLNIEFTSEFAEGYKIEISNVKLERYRDKGNYKHRPSPQWSDVEYSKTGGENATAAATFSLPTGENANVAAKAYGTAPEKKVTTGYVYAIPCNYNSVNNEGVDNVAISFDIRVISDKGEEVLARRLSGTWAPNWGIGTSYTYNIAISGTAAKLEPIVFETAEDMNLDWTGGSTSSIDMVFSAN